MNFWCSVRVFVREALTFMLLLALIYWGVWTLMLTLADLPEQPAVEFVEERSDV